MSNTRTETIFNSMDYILDHKLSGGPASERELVWEKCLQNCAFLGARKAVMSNWNEDSIDNYRMWLETGRVCGEGSSISVLPSFNGALEVSMAEMKNQDFSMGRTM